MFSRSLFWRPLVAASLLVVSAHVAFAGDKEGNGGDVVLCEHSPDNALEGYYSLDYVLAAGGTNLPVESWDQYADRLEARFREVDWYLATHFRVFRARLFQSGLDVVPGDYKVRYRWKEAPYGLIDIKDEGLISHVPPNCFRKDSAGQPQFIQAVNRQPMGTHHVFYYDAGILKKLPALQLSFLLVHEWLWDLVSDPVTLRDVNEQLHSEVFFQGPLKMAKALFNELMLPRLPKLRTGLYLPDQPVEGIVLGSAGGGAPDQFQVTFVPNPNGTGRTRLVGTKVFVDCRYNWFLDLSTCEPPPNSVGIALILLGDDEFECLQTRYTLSRPRL